MRNYSSVQNALPVAVAASLPGLDGVRGAAALLVILSHAANRGIVPFAGFDFTGMGKLGVFVFFVLSSFLLSRQMLTASAERFGSLRFHTHFFHRRFARILPLFGLSALVYWGVGFEGGAGEPYFDSIIHVLAVWTTWAPGPGIFWAIAPEVHFYLLLPLLIALVRPFRSRRGWLLLTLIGSVILSTACFGASFDAGLPPFLGLFLSGMAAALVEQDFRDYLARPWGQRVLACIGPLALIVFTAGNAQLLSWVLGKHIPSTLINRQFIVFAVAAALLVLAAASNGNAVARLFSLRPMRFLGKISFSLYLWHMLLVEPVAVVAVPGGDVVRLFLVIAIALPLATLSYRWIERPVLKSVRLERAWFGLISIVSGRSMKNFFPTSMGGKGETRPE